MCTHCYFLVFRVPRVGGLMDWGKPRGGLVMDAKVVHGIAIADFQLARDVLEQRYHCHADEHLLIAEVLQPEEQRAALTLHRLWEVETAEFVELMEVSENPR